MPDGAVSPPEAELAALDRLFSTLIRERISHGDLKGHNLFWQAHEQGGEWALIDLDAMRKHHSQVSFARAYARDRALPAQLAAGQRPLPAAGATDSPPRRRRRA